MAHESLPEFLERVYLSEGEEIGCDLLQALLPAYVDLELTGPDPSERAQQVHTHLIQCPDCWEEYEALRQVVALHAEGQLPEIDELLAQIQKVPLREPAKAVPVPADD